MARFPIASARESLQVPRNTPDVRVSPAVGVALNSLGATADDVAHHWAQRQEQADRFKAEQTFMQMQNDIEADDIKAADDMAADGSGWAESRVTAARVRSKAWLDALPIGLREEYAERLDTWDGGYRNAQFRVENGQRERWALQGIDTAANNLMNRVYGNPNGRAEAEATLRRIIEAAPISRAGKDEALRKSLGMFDEPAAMSYVESGDFDAARGVVASASSYRDTTRGHESGGNDQAESATSSAAGRYQITAPTYRSLANSPEGEAAGLPRIGKGDPVPTDAAVQEAAMTILTNRNAGVLRREGIPVTGKTLRMLHFLGPSGGPKAMRADMNANAAEMFPEQAAANKSVFYAKDGSARTVGEVIRSQTARYSNAPISDEELTTVAGPDYSRTTALARTVESRINQKEAEARALATEQFNLYMTGASDKLAFAASGGILNPADAAKYAPDSIRAFGTPEAERAAQVAEDAFRQGDAIRSFKNAGTPEARVAVLTAQLEALKSPQNFEANTRTAKLITEAFNELNQRLVTEPGEVAAESGQVQEAFKAGGPAGVAAMLAEQERLGVPAWRRVPLPESYAKAEAARIESLGAEAQGEEIESMAASYGVTFGRVWSQIGAKMPAEMAVAASMTDERARTLLIADSRLKAEERTAGLTDSAKGDIEEALADDERMLALASSLALDGSAGTLPQTLSAATTLALGYMRREGLDANEAAARASAAVTGSVDFAEYNGAAVRVPAGQDIDAVERGMSDAIDNFQPLTVDLPQSTSGMSEDEVREDYAERVRSGRSVRWLNDADGVGLYLWDGQSVVTRNGVPVLWTWGQLKAASP